MVRVNPFPDYPVIRLKEEPGNIKKLTIPTEAIIRSRSLVNHFIEQWNNKNGNSTQKVESLIVAVKGDYGTGKTHLLLDAAAQVQEGFSSTFPDVAILRISCIEADPVKWFQTKIGHELKQPFIQNIIIRLYARAGQKVASQAKLTKAAEEKLKQDPWSIHSLIKENLLSSTDVDQEFKVLLKDICHDASEEVCNALTGLIWSETSDISIRWLKGEALKPEELDRVRISKNLTNEIDAGDLLVSLAAIHSYLGFPFVIMIDELEHFTRHDTVHNSKQNITWLKRLMEGLANNQILILIAGHWSAWEAQSDYLDRFSQLRPIELVKLTNKEVLEIVHARVNNISPDIFGLSQGEAIAKFGNGNIRRILSICRVLFRDSEGFSLPVNNERIRELSEEIGQRISIENAALSVREILEQQRLNVHREASIAKGIRFDLIGYCAEQPKVVVDLKHAVTQGDQLDHARRFREQMKEVSKLFPNVIGCFISDGNVDDELLSILKSDMQITILWFDLNQRDAISKIATDVQTALRGKKKIDATNAYLQELLDQSEKLLKQTEVAQSVETVEKIKQLKAQREAIEQEVNDLRERILTRNVDMEKQLDSFEGRLSFELNQLYKRLEELSREVKSKRDAEIIAPTREEVDVKLHALYSDLTRHPSFVTKLRMGGGLNFFWIICLFASIAGVFLLISFPTLFYRPSDMLPIYIMLLVLSISSLGYIWQSINRIETFLEFSSRTLREVYIRSANSQDLIKVDNILRNSIEDFGPFLWRKEANIQLANAYPEIFSYLDENYRGGSVDMLDRRKNR